MESQPKTQPLSPSESEKKKKEEKKKRRKKRNFQTLWRKESP